MMLKGRATAKATAAYESRFPELPGNFRPALGVSVSSIGIGTYLGEPDDETDRAYEAAIKASLRGGINLIDTAVNYRFQRSERNIGAALGELVAGGEIERDQVVVATKGGYITFDGEVPPNPRAWFEEHYVKTGIVAPADLVDGSHCMTPKYIGTMLEFLEGAVANGKIGVYGTATWNGFRAAPTERGWLSLDELMRVAREVAGDAHHFRAIQLPYNLAMPEAVTRSNQFVHAGKATTLAAAKALGLAVSASASLLQGQLSRGLPPIVANAFSGYATDAQRSIQFVRSTPGVDVALVGMKSVDHVRDTLETARKPPATLEELMRLFQQGGEP